MCTFLRGYRIYVYIRAMSDFTNDTGFFRMIPDFYGQYRILTDDTEFFTDYTEFFYG
jgi:hypothetical protein